jgi:hypothetical protein
MVIAHLQEAVPLTPSGQIRWVDWHSNTVSELLYKLDTASVNATSCFSIKRYWTIRRSVEITSRGRVALVSLQQQLVNIYHLAVPIGTLERALTVYPSTTTPHARTASPTVAFGQYVRGYPWLTQAPNSLYSAAPQRPELAFWMRCMDADADEALGKDDVRVCFEHKQSVLARTTSRQLATYADVHAVECAWTVLCDLCRVPVTTAVITTGDIRKARALPFVLEMLLGLNDTRTNTCYSC